MRSVNELVITYCKPCGYLVRALATSNALAARHPLLTRLVPGKAGVFEVALNGVVVAKKQGGKFPTEVHLVEAVSRMLEPSHSGVAQVT